MSLAAPQDDLQRVKSYQWPAAHVGHLNDHQSNALEAFTKLCQERGYYSPATDTSPPTHDEETLLRYLRARKFVPEDAFAQFKDTEDWRKENQLDTLYDTIDVHEYEQTRRLYPQWTGRRDKRGIPLYVYEIQHVDAKDVTAFSSGKDAKSSQASITSKTPRKMLRLFALYENLCRFVLPFCSAIPDRPNAETPISQSSNVVDLSKVGFTKFWSLRNHMSDASALATAHYPETLDRIFVIGAPSFFPTVWGWAKKWFDPITVSKIFILNDKQVFPTLSQYVHPDNIPKKYGGNLDWKFGDLPFLEPHLASTLRWKETIEEKGHKTLPIGPIKWQYDKDGDLVATAIGTENGKPRHRVIAGLHPEAGVARLALSPGRADKSSTFTSPGAAAATQAPVTTPPTSAPTPTTTSTTTTHKMDPKFTQGKPPTSAVPSDSRAGTYTIPYRDTANGISSPPPDARQGTSSTRFEQQAGTHAHGQLAAGTPETRNYGGSAGENVGVMEPNTVGQAPKEYPMPPKQDAQGEQGEGHGMMERAQEVAASYLPATVLSAVGMGGGKKEEGEGSREVKRDPAVDGMDDRQVEEFLRQKAMSRVG